MHAEGINRPSTSCIPSLVIDFTWTAGGFWSARMLVKELSYLAGLARMPLECELASIGLRDLRREDKSLSVRLAAHRREGARTNRKDM